MNKTHVVLLVFVAFLTVNQVNADLSDYIFKQNTTNNLEVVVQSVRTSYVFGTNIRPETYIMNYGTTNEENVVLTYILYDAEGQLNNTVKVMIGNVTPMCVNAEYQKTTGRCVSEAGTFKPIHTHVNATIPIPENGTDGTWQLDVHYDSDQRAGYVASYPISTHSPLLTATTITIVIFAMIVLTQITRKNHE